MNITPGERILYAFFDNLVFARQAAESLERVGFELPIVDRTDRFDKDVFLNGSALHPDGEGETISGVDFSHSFFFTLRTTDNNTNKAIKIIRKHGGKI